MNFRAIRAAQEPPKQGPRAQTAQHLPQPASIAPRAGAPHPSAARRETIARSPGGTHNQCLVPAHAGTNNPHRRRCPSALAYGNQPPPPEPAYTKSNPVPAPAGINPRVCIGNSISPRRGDQPGSTQ